MDEASGNPSETQVIGSSEADAMRAERDVAFEALEGFVEKVEKLAG